MYLAVQEAYQFHTTVKVQTYNEMNPIKSLQKVTQ